MAQLTNAHTITLVTPLVPIVHENTNQNFAKWLAAHPDPTYSAQAATWQFPVNESTLNGLRNRK